jgi:hypothetical protein
MKFPRLCTAYAFSTASQQRFCAIAILVVKFRFYFHKFVQSSRVYSVSISATVAKPQDVMRYSIPTMRLQIIFKEQNPNYNKDYADQYFEGKESVDNCKDNWSLTSEMNVQKFFFSKTNEINVKMHNRIGFEIDVQLKDVIVLNCLTIENELVEIIISKKLIKRTLKNHIPKYDLARIYFYFNPKMEYVKIDSGFYLLKEDVPNEIKNIA